MLKEVQNLIIDGVITPSETVVLLILLREVDIITVTASLNELAEGTNISKPCISRTLKSLSEKRVIDIDANYHADGGRLPNTYTVLL